MQVFTYKAKDSAGLLVQAEVEATTASEAAKLLTAKNLFPYSIEPRKEGGFAGISLESLNRITFKDKLIFTRQLATLVKAGLPLAPALRILISQTENPKMLRLVTEISNTVEGGTALSVALAKHPDLFNTIYISMVEAGEVSGNLDETLQRLANQEEKAAAINSKIKGALTYPLVVLAVLIAVMILMVVLVLPQVGKMYSDLKQPLPPLTQALLAVSHAFVHFWYLFIVFFAGLAYAARLWAKTPSGKSKIDTFKMIVPGFGLLVKKLYMARFARTLGGLVTTGVPVLQAMAITAKSMNNVHMEKAVNDVATKVKSGIVMSKPILEDPLFIPLVGQMLSVGEQTGTMGDSLNRVAQYFEDEVDEAVKNISTLIEPATMVILGGLVAFLIAAVLLPVYGLVTKIQ